MSRTGAATRAPGLLVGLLVGTVGALSTLAACSSSPPEGLHGRFVTVSDTGGGDSPVTDGELVVLPQDVVTDVLPDFVDDRPYLQAVETEVTAAGLDSAGARRYTTDSKGRFTFDVEPGPYVVCYAPQEAGGDPVLIHACQVVTLPRDADLGASIGEAPFVFTVSP